MRDKTVPLSDKASSVIETNVWGGNMLNMQFDASRGLRTVENVIWIDLAQKLLRLSHSVLALLVGRKWAEISFAGCQSRCILRWREHVVVEVICHWSVEVVLKSQSSDTDS